MAEQRTETMDINMGPQHPATHGVMRLKLTLHGERIVKCEPVIGYLHRGMEKLCETMKYPQITPLTDRADYTVATAGNIAHILAVEELLDVEVPKRAQYLRIIFAELGRIVSHLVWLATHALDIGAITIFVYAFRERETILDIFSEFCGARLTLNIMKIGGFYEDLLPETADKIRTFCKELPDYLEDYERILNDNRIWKKRTIEVGELPPEKAVSLGTSGPVIRGSGIKWDVRKAQPYSAYEDFDFKIPTGDGENCDTYDR